MGKKTKAAAAYTEGREAAHAGQGRSTNPYPHSMPKDRHEWFKGYDEMIDKPKKRQS